MPRTPTLENPFAPEKHRSADDPKFVGKILGPKAEAAMRRTVADKVGRADKADTQGDLALTPEQKAQRDREKEKREAPERVRRDLLAWAEDLGKDDDWVKETFTFQPDGSLIVLGDLNVGKTPCDRLPQGLKEVRGDLFLDGLTSAEHLTLPKAIGGFLSLDGLTSAEHLTLPASIGGHLFLNGLTSAEHLALPTSIGGDLYLDGLTSAEHLALPTSIGGSLSLDRLPNAEKEKLRKERPDLKIH